MLRAQQLIITKAVKIIISDNWLRSEVIIYLELINKQIRFSKKEMKMLSLRICASSQWKYYILILYKLRASLFLSFSVLLLAITDILCRGAANTYRSTMIQP